jgi:hypothetical protein
MTTKKLLTKLTPEQEARMASFAQEWIEQGWRTMPLTEEEWAVVEAGMQRCYEFANIPWPGVVVRVPSPLVGAFSAPAAAYAIEVIRRRSAESPRPTSHPAVYGAVGGAVYGAVDGAVYGAVDGAVYGAVYGAVDRAVDGAVDGAVGRAVGRAVYGAVDGAVDGREVMQAVSQLWSHRFGGRLWPRWQAFVAFFRDVVKLQLDEELWERSRAYETAQSAGWWWPFKDFVMVCEPPTELHLEQVGPTGWGSHRLHCETGPAARWSDGWGVYFWHGTEVPADLIETGWDVEKIMAETNTEVRRCAIEKLGWDRMIAHLGVEPIDTCADPGNAPHELALYRLPDKVNPYGEPVNLLLMTNGSPDRSGELRKYGETVPANITSAAAAAGWQYGLSPSVYSQLERRT